MKPLWSIVLMLLPLKVMACGLDWSPPVSHFENVDYQGNVNIVRTLGEVESLPIYLIFNSSYGVSPYVGAGFEIPLLESRIWQVDENRFQARMPSGWLWMFQRTKDPSVLEGNAGWKGLVKDDTITVWADCGSKIVYKDGRIVAMQLKDEKLDYAYKNNKVESIQKNGRTILKVKTDEKTGNVCGINFPNTREEIALKQSEIFPKVETIAGLAVVSRMENTLSVASNTNGSTELWEFGVDRQMNPTVKFNQKTVVWNSATRKIIQAGEWIYKVTPATDNLANTPIERINANNESEYWFYDSINGKEETRNLNGTINRISWFTTGLLAGEPRKKTQISQHETIEKDYSYNENGKPLRLITSVNGVIKNLRTWKADGSSLEVPHNNLIGAISCYDPQGVVRGIYINSNSPNSTSKND